MIECYWLSTAKTLHDQGLIECNFIYVQPSCVEELSNRIIRQRPGGETADSLMTKMHYAMREMEVAKSCSFLNVFTNDHEKEFVGKATSKVIHDLYKLRG